MALLNHLLDFGQNHVAQGSIARTRDLITGRLGLLCIGGPGLLQIAVLSGLYFGQRSLSPLKQASVLDGVS